MRQRYTFQHDHYYNTLKEQIGQGIPVFHGVRQRGRGLGSVLGGFAKYALPLLMKWVLPHAKQAALKTVSDIAGGRHSVKSALKHNSIGFLKDVGENIIHSVVTKTKQTGKGVKKRTYTRTKSTNKPKKARVARKPVVNKRKRKATPKRKPTASKRSRLDIFQ